MTRRTDVTTVLFVAAGLPAPLVKSVEEAVRCLRVDMAEGCVRPASDAVATYTFYARTRSRTIQAPFDRACVEARSWFSRQYRTPVGPLTCSYEEDANA